MIIINRSRLIGTILCLAIVYICVFVTNIVFTVASDRYDIDDNVDIDIDVEEMLVPLFRCRHPFRTKMLYENGSGRGSDANIYEYDLKTRVSVHKSVYDMRLETFDFMGQEIVPLNVMDTVGTITTVPDNPNEFRIQLADNILMSYTCPKGMIYQENKCVIANPCLNRSDGKYDYPMNIIEILQRITNRSIFDRRNRLLDFYRHHHQHNHRRHNHHGRIRSRQSRSSREKVQNSLLRAPPRRSYMTCRGGQLASIDECPAVNEIFVAGQCINIDPCTANAVLEKHSISFRDSDRYLVENKAAMYLCDETNRTSMLLECSTLQDRQQSSQSSSLSSTKNDIESRMNVFDNTCSTIRDICSGDISTNVPETVFIDRKRFKYCAENDTNSFIECGSGRRVCFYGNKHTCCDKECSDNPSGLNLATDATTNAFYPGLMQRKYNCIAGSVHSTESLESGNLKIYPVNFSHCLQMVVDESAIDGVTVHLSHDDNNINNNHDDDFFPFPLYLSVPREYYNHGGSYNDNSDGKESRREIFKIEGDVPSSPVPVPVRFRRKDLPFDPRGYQGLVSRNRSTGVFDLVDIDECPCACSGTTININTTDSDTPAYNYFPSTDTTYKCPERTVVKLPSFDTLQFPDGRQVTVANNPCSSSSLSKSAAGFITRPIKGGFVACAGRYPVETLMETKIMATTMTTTTTTKTTTTSTTADTTTTTTTDPVVSRVFDKKCTKYRGILDRCLGCIVDGCVASDSGIRYIPTYPNNRPDSLFTKDFIVSVMMAEINKSYMYQKLKTTKDILEQFG